MNKKENKKLIAREKEAVAYDEVLMARSATCAQCGKIEGCLEGQLVYVEALYIKTSRHLDLFLHNLETEKQISGAAVVGFLKASAILEASRHQFEMASVDAYDEFEDERPSALDRSLIVDEAERIIKEGTNCARSKDVR